MSPISLVASLLFTTSVTLAQNDVLQLVGGDSLRGVIVSQTETSVTLDHPALGRIDVARSRIASIELGTPVVVAPVAEVLIAPASAGATTTPTPVLATVPTTVPTSVPTAVLPAREPAPKAKPTGEWKFSLSFSLTGSQNSDGSNLDFRAAASGKRESETDRTTVGLEYYFGSAAGANTDNNVLASAMEEFLFRDSKWEAFVQTTYQYDEFQDWE